MNKSFNKKYNFKRYNSLGNEEIKAAQKVIRSGKLSPFLGAWELNKNVGNFYGGKKINKFEDIIKKHFKTKYAVAVNSWTSGLIAAVGALDINPGDEIITSPWSMCASATCIIHWMAVPVFADIEIDTFNLCPISVEKKITSRTKAIIVPDIFGHSSNIKKFKRIAKKYNLRIISDSAQAINSKVGNKYTGTFFDIGGFSFNYHKHIQSGEGGVLVTNSKKIAEKMQLIRNHGEAVVGKRNFKDIKNIIGYNFRLGEIESAILIEQIKKLNSLVKKRENLGKFLIKSLSNLKNLHLPKISKNHTHSFYIFGMRLDKKISKYRNKIHSALINEGVPINKQYANLHLLPMFQRRIAYGKGFPWNKLIYKGKVSYKKGICPNAETLQNKEYLGINLCDYDFNMKNVTVIVKAFYKVWKNLGLEIENKRDK